MPSHVKQGMSTGTYVAITVEVRQQGKVFEHDMDSMGALAGLLDGPITAYFQGAS